MVIITDSAIFKKMRLKSGISGKYLYAPEEYIQMTENQDVVDFSEHGKYDFVHLFIESQNDYHDRIDETLSLLSDSGILWISYPKSTSKVKYDVNRNVLFTITQENGYIACSNVALDDKWSAMRFKKK